MLNAKFLEKFGKEMLIFDGAMGTQLIKYGLKSGELPENMNLERPDVLLKIHKEYLDSGCDIVTTNTFGANAIKLNNVAENVAAAVALARKAVRESAKEAFVALDIGPLGKLFEPYGELTFDCAYELFKEQVTAGEKAGADLILIETMGDLYEIKAAVSAAKENTDLPVLASMIFDGKGRLLMGADIKTAVLTLESFGVDGIGLNCGLGPDQMVSIFGDAVKWASVPVFSQPNAGLPDCKNGVTTYAVTPEAFAAKQYEIASMGAAALGGCCGTSPEYIKALSEKCKSISVKSAADKNITAATSYSKTVALGGDIKISEKIKGDDIIDLCLDEADNGTDILYVEASKDTVSELQGIINTPLMFAPSDDLEEVLRIYNGKPMVKATEKTLPLIKKYGAVAVADTSEEALKAADFGIEKKNIVLLGSIRK